jgi:hypothetical protein
MRNRKRYKIFRSALHRFQRYSILNSRRYGTRDLGDEVRKHLQLSGFITDIIRHCRFPPMIFSTEGIR